VGESAAGPDVGIVDGWFITYRVAAAGTAVDRITSTAAIDRDWDRGAGPSMNLVSGAWFCIGSRRLKITAGDRASRGFV